MSRYPLQDLVRARHHREERTSEATARASAAVREAQAELTRSQTALAEYTVWRRDEERRKLDGVMRRVLPFGELADVRQEIGLLRDREFEYIDAVRQAEAAVEKAQAHLSQCRQAQAQALRELEKLRAHQAEWERDEARARELAEERELEEFNAPARGLVEIGS